MPKSRNRKDHKKKVAARNNRLRAQRNALNKRIQEYLMQKQSSLGSDENTQVNNNNDGELND
jgi:hypothetical protein